MKHWLPKILVTLIALAFFGIWIETIPLDSIVEGDEIGMAWSALLYSRGEIERSSLYRFDSSPGVYLFLLTAHELSGIEPLVLFRAAAIIALAIFLAAVAFISKRLFSLPWPFTIASALLIQEIHASGLYANDGIIAASLAACGISAICSKFKPAAGALLGGVLLIAAALVRMDYCFLFPCAFTVLLAVQLERGCEKSAAVKFSLFWIAALSAGFIAAFFATGATIDGLISNARRHYDLMAQPGYRGGSQFNTLATFLTPLNIALLIGGGVSVVRERRALLPLLAAVIAAPLAVFYWQALTTPKYLIPLLLVLIPLQALGMIWVYRLPRRLRVAMLSVLALLLIPYFLTRFSEREGTSFSFPYTLAPGKSRYTHDGPRMWDGIFLLPHRFTKWVYPLRTRRVALRQEIEAWRSTGILCVEVETAFRELTTVQYDIAMTGFRKNTSGLWSRPGFAASIAVFKVSEPSFAGCSKSFRF